jgi:hypothetical protein
MQKVENQKMKTENDERRRMMQMQKNKESMAVVTRL